MNKTFILKDGREAYDFPWTNSQIAQPWKQGYHRVIVPFTAKERINALPGKTAHVQVIHGSKLKLKES